MVTASGETPILSSQRASGENRAVKKPRACLFSILLPGCVLRRGHFLRPCVGDLLTDLTEGLRDRLGLGNDREEISVTAPARHHVLVQVAGDARPAGDALVHAQVETGGVGDLAQHPHGRLGQFGEFRRFLDREVRVVRDVPVGADQQVARVVRKEVQHHVARPSRGRRSGSPRRPRSGATQNGQSSGFLNWCWPPLMYAIRCGVHRRWKASGTPARPKSSVTACVARILRPGPCGFLHALPFRLR